MGRNRPDYRARKLIAEEWELWKLLPHDALLAKIEQRFVRRKTGPAKGYIPPKSKVKAARRKAVETMRKNRQESEDLQPVGLVDLTPYPLGYTLR